VGSIASAARERAVRVGRRREEAAIARERRELALRADSTPVLKLRLPGAKLALAPALPWQRLHPTSTLTMTLTMTSTLTPALSLTAAKRYVDV
jgi:hypothetical protein